jgi:hypothetical protein
MSMCVQNVNQIYKVECRGGWYEKAVNSNAHPNAVAEIKVGEMALSIGM